MPLQPEVPASRPGHSQRAAARLPPARFARTYPALSSRAFPRWNSTETSCEEVEPHSGRRHARRGARAGCDSSFRSPSVGRTVQSNPAVSMTHPVARTSSEPARETARKRRERAPGNFCWRGERTLDAFVSCMTIRDAQQPPRPAMAGSFRSGEWEHRSEPWWLLSFDDAVNRSLEQEMKS